MIALMNRSLEASVIDERDDEGPHALRQGTLKGSNCVTTPRARNCLQI